MRVQQERATQAGLIVEQLRQVHEGGAWHGPSLGEALAGLGAAEALRRPIGAAHSVWEIVHHARVTSEGVRRRLTGEGAAGEPDWPKLTDTTESAWQAEVQALQAAQRALREAVSSLPDARLPEAVPGQGHSFWHELMGLLHHDAYHAGRSRCCERGGMPTRSSRLRSARRKSPNRRTPTDGWSGAGSSTCSITGPTSRRWA
jgi:uncharacterized damage-inducible protein DinB